MAPPVCLHMSCFILLNSQNDCVLQTVMQGTIPYLGTFLTDLVMMDTAMKDYLDVSICISVSNYSLTDTQIVLLTSSAWRLFLSSVVATAVFI